MIWVLVQFCFFIIYFFIILFFHFCFLVQKSASEKKRQNLIDELYQTEVAYVDNLKLVFEVFYYYTEQWTLFHHWYLKGFHKKYPCIQHAVQAGIVHSLHKLEGSDCNKHQVIEVYENPANYESRSDNYRRYFMWKCRFKIEF